MSKTQPHVTLVTPVFNRIKHTRKFLQSLTKQTYTNTTIVIIDDGSSDNTSDMVKSEFPKVVLLQGDGNLWWSGGTNKGVEYAIKKKSDYVLTINDDVEVAPDYIASLVKVGLEHPLALIGSKVCYRDDRDRVWFFGATFGSNGDMKHTTGSDKQITVAVKSDWLTGMGVLIPTSAFTKAGLYDAKNFPQYFGDAEFSLRAKLHGYELWVSPDSRVYADVDASWVLNQINNPKLSFPRLLFTSIRSPYQWHTRSLFYKLYWPKNYRLALLRLYSITLIGLYKSFVFAYTKKLLGIKRFRDVVPGLK